LEALLKNTIHLNWITCLYVIAFILLAILRKINPYHFKNFLLLIVSDKYIKTHKEDTSKKRLHYSLLLFQLVITPLMMQISLTRLNILPNNTFITYCKLLAFYLIFYYTKYLLEKGSSIVFNEKIKISSYIFQKQAYFNYISVCLFPILLLLTYPVVNIPNFTIYILLFSYLFFTTLGTTLAIINHRSFFYSKPYYFILYLCAFEIAPYILSFFLIK